MLKVWASFNNARKRKPMALFIQDQSLGDHSTGWFNLVWYKMWGSRESAFHAVVKQLEQMAGLSANSPQPTPECESQAKYIEVIRSFYKEYSHPEWFALSMKEQAQFMAKLMKERKALGLMDSMWNEYPQHPAWPAFARMDGEDIEEEQVPKVSYKAEYVAGLVCSRQ